MTYTFNTEILFEILKLVKTAEKDVEEIAALFRDITHIPEDGDILKLISPDRIITTMVKVIGTAGTHQEIVIHILALATRQTDEKVRQMDAIEFVKEYKAFLSSIRWSEILGELAGSLNQKEDQSEGNESR